MMISAIAPFPRVYPEQKRSAIALVDRVRVDLPEADNPHRPVWLVKSYLLQSGLRSAASDRSALIWAVARCLQTLDVRPDLCEAGEAVVLARLLLLDLALQRAARERLARAGTLKGSPAPLVTSVLSDEDTLMLGWPPESVRAVAEGRFELVEGAAAVALAERLSEALRQPSCADRELRRIDSGGTGRGFLGQVAQIVGWRSRAALVG